MDSDVRLQACDPAASFLVQAPAGSGKTELLTRRILKLLTVVDEPEEILALTFTRKAAAEMRGRVLEALNMDKPQDASSHRMQTWQLAEKAKARSEMRDWQLLNNPSRLRMMTLDSFMHALAGQMPLLSGFGEMPVACSHPIPLYREAAEIALNSLIRRAQDQAGTLLLHQDNNTTALIKLVADMLGKRDQWLGEVQQHAADTSELRRMLENSLCDIMLNKIAECDALMPAQVKDELPSLMVFAGENIGDDALRQCTKWPDTLLASLPQWRLIAGFVLTADDKKTALRKQFNAKLGFPPGKKSLAEKEKIKSLIDLIAATKDLAEALQGLRTMPDTSEMDDAQWQVLEALFALVLMADMQLQRLFEQRGEADFIEISLRAMHALEDADGRPSDLLLKLDYRIRHILVDEFQDTSLLQIRLLQSLTTGWQAGDGIARSLFMVGDPMQSIYRFRKAEVGLFLLAARNRAGLPPVETLTLKRNFRSSPAIVGWVNRAFADIFPGEADILRGAVEYTPAAAALNHAGSVRLHVQQQADEQQEAEAVVAAVKEQLRMPSSGSGKTQKIAILARSRKHLHAIMPALRAADIDFRAVDILPLNKQPEIRQMRALLRALLHPADRESWAALLRGPCCGLSTQEMHTLLAGDARPVVSILNDTTRVNRLNGETIRRIRHLQAALAPCLQLTGRVGLRHLLTSAWQRIGMADLLGADSVEMDWMGEDAARNVEALLTLVDELDGGGNIAFSLLDERLERLYAAPDASPQAANVELLTMHGAKGLQWDVVILPGLGKKQAKTDTPLLAFTDIPVQGGAHPLMAVRAAVRRNDMVYNMIQSVEKTREKNESERLLYVACTRAETSLLMFGHVSEKSGLATSGSLLSLILTDGVVGGSFDAEVVEIEAVEGKASTVRNALRRIKTPVDLPANPVSKNADVEPEFAWAGVEAASIGIALHAGLQKVAEKGVEMWQTADSKQVQIVMQRILLLEGLSAQRLEDALATAMQGLNQALASERGRWILSAQHQQAHAEWSLSTNVHGRIRTRVIDRCFVDDAGVRWIVDYKTGTHEGSDLKRFLGQERERYRAQLEEYAQLVGQMDRHAHPIRLALYFPLLDAWDAWAAGAVTTAK
ncbi:MAG: UvrD-helicase domain-containing protein [Mariprofundaceae bacterium]